MPKWLTSCVSCFNPDSEVNGIRGDGRIILNPLTRPNFDNPSLWMCHHGWTAESNFDFAVSKSRIEVTPRSCITRSNMIEGGVVICICEGHGSNAVCANFVRSKLPDAILREGILNMSENALRNTFIRVEERWMESVAKLFVRGGRDRYRMWASSGTSCLVGIIANGSICIGNVGDSRAVIQTLDESNNKVPVALTIDDNINDPTVRATVLAEHPQEPDYLVQDETGTYFIKGITQWSKSFGDAFLKVSEFTLDDDPTYRLNSPLPRAAVSALPYTAIRAITAQDDYIIFASQELWRIMSQQEVVFVVNTCPREGIASTVIRHALDIVAQSHNMTYPELQQINRENVSYHNDIAVAIVFFRAEGEDIEGLDVASEGTGYFTALEDDLEDELTRCGGGGNVGSSSGGGGNVGSSSGGEGDVAS